MTPKKLKQNRPTPSISLGLNYFKKMKQKRPTTLIRIQHYISIYIMIVAIQQRPWTRCCFRWEIEGSNGRIMVDYGKGKSKLVGGQCRRSSQLDLIISVASSIFLCIFTILSIRANTPYRPQHFSDLQNLRAFGTFLVFVHCFFWV